MSTILPECGGFIGILEAVEPEGGAAIAQIDGRRYEAPADMIDELQALVGQRTIIACIAGQVRAGRTGA
jgi:hypothetical protein